MDRDIHARTIMRVEATSIDALAKDLRVPSDHFVLAIAADSTNYTGPDLVSAATALIERGASYVCCWGPGAERLHDCFDEAELDPDADSVDAPIVMTTWHEDESLEEMIWFALNSTVPTSHFIAETRTVVLASIGNREWAGQMKAYVESGAPLRSES